MVLVLVLASHWMLGFCCLLPSTSNRQQFKKQHYTTSQSPTTTTTTTSPYQPSHPTPLSPDPPSLKFCFGFRPSPPFSTLSSILDPLLHFRPSPCLPPSLQDIPKTGHLSKLFLSFSVYSPGFSPPEP
uniref:Uncharacterized protein n=1 Tax=Physcomitrium patens TaxID=3218 RepID=A0A2K1J0J3_PHYPA|nr:hypothetical protein PHYPA_022943 [Physcomitrium patens]